MNRKLIYIFSLIGFFLMWGLFGFAAATPRGDNAPQITVPSDDSHAVNPDLSADAVVPGVEEQPATRVMLLYVLLAYGVLVVILALLNAANKPTTTYVRRKEPPDQS